jgi:hypothetical protein
MGFRGSPGELYCPTQALAMKVKNTGRAVSCYIVLAIVLMESLCGFRAAGQSRSRPGGIGDCDQQSLQVPVGTVLPVRLNHGFSSKNARNGQPITGRIMQEVPLPSAGKIKEGQRYREQSYR